MPEKLDRCVAHVKNDPGVDNPWAVCNASISETCEICGLEEGSHGMFSDHKYQRPMQLVESFSIGGGLSAQSVGAKTKKVEEIAPCSCFDTVHEALKSETKEGGPGSGPQPGQGKGYPVEKPRRIVGYQGPNMDIPIYDYGDPKHQIDED